MFSVPEQLEFACPHCGEPFWLAARSLEGRKEVFCPCCGEASGWLDAVDPDFRREVVQEVREKLHLLADDMEEGAQFREGEITAEVIQLLLEHGPEGRRRN
jgi:uncharacterized Zn finger protein (UPF0148 family)